MKQHLIILIVCLTIVFNSYCQTKSKNSPKDFEFSTFSIKGSLDSINFIVSDTSLKEMKPVFLFCQGSLPYALFYKEDSLHTWQQSLPFDYKKYKKDYYFVIISKSGLPVFSTTADSNYFYIDPITKQTPDKYFENDNLNYRVTATNDVINFLLKQKWVDKTKFIIAGHSEGTKVIVKACASNKNITDVIFLAGNPYSRFDQGIREIQSSVLLGKLTDEEGQKEIDELNKQIEFWYNHPNDSAPTGTNEYFRNYTSFYEPIMPYILKIKVPLFVAFGTKDIISENCNLLPFEFARTGKKNLTIKSYLGCDHGFVKNVYDKSGKIISSEEMFDKVASDFFKWLKDSK
jgi:dienelactone hydrolase